MFRKVRNLALTAVAPLVLLLLVWNLLGPDPSEVEGSQPAPNAEAVSPSSVGAPPGPAAEDGSRLYSIGAYRLKGLSPSTPPGTPLEIWVSWSAKVSGAPKLQRLIRSAVLEGIEPGPVPEAPSIATLRLSVKELPDMIWGEMFGELAVAARPD